MHEKFDINFFNKVKAKFSAKPAEIIFISLTSENVDELVAQTYTQESFDEYYEFVDEHCENAKPYVVIGWLESDEYTYCYVCKELLRKEDYVTGKLVNFRLDPFRKLNTDINLLKADFAKLTDVLKGDSEAS